MFSFILFTFLDLLTIVNCQACCPEGAWGELKNPNYQDLGQVEELKKSAMDIYHIGKEITLVKYLNNYFNLHVCLSIRVRGSVFPCVRKLTPIPAVV